MYAGGVCKKAQKFRSKRGTQVMEGTWLKNERRAVVSSDAVGGKAGSSTVHLCANAASPAPLPFIC